MQYICVVVFCLEVFLYNQLIYNQLIEQSPFEQMNSNILYEIKKQSLKNASPMYQPNSVEQDLREDNKKLRTINRTQQTQIFRLKAKIHQLKDRIVYFQSVNKLSFDLQPSSRYQTTHMQDTLSNTQNAVQSFSKVPMLLQNAELKQSNDVLHRQNLALNGKNNQLQIDNRTLDAEFQRLKTKVKELEIIEKMREGLFKDELEKLTSIVVQQPAQYPAIKEGVMKIADCLRERVVEVVFYIFQISAKQCQSQKKVTSFTIFANYWKQIKKNKNQGYAAVVSSYKSMRKLVSMIDEEYLCLGQSEEIYRDTMNQWILNSLIEIKHTPTTEKNPENRLFRLLGLQYRSNFPIKGEKFQKDHDIKQHLENLIAIQVQRLL